MPEAPDQTSSVTAEAEALVEELWDALGGADRASAEATDAADACDAESGAGCAYSRSRGGAVGGPFVDPEVLFGLADLLDAAAVGMRASARRLAELRDAGDVPQE